MDFPLYFQTRLIPWEGEILEILYWIFRILVLFYIINPAWLVKLSDFDFDPLIWYPHYGDHQKCEQTNKHLIFNLTAAVSRFSQLRSASHKMNTS